MSNHIILVGIGRLGYRAFGLLRRLGESVVVLERDPQNRFLEEVRRDGSPLLIGDARDEALLVAANIAAARSVIVATNDDLGNLEIALDARRLKPGIRIVLRLFDQNMADKIRDGFNIHLAMSQSAMAAPAFALAALDPSIVNSFVMGSQLVAMQQLVLPQRSPLAGRTVAAVMKEYGCGVAQVSSTGRPPILFPAPETLLRAGDELLIQGPLSTLARLREQAR